MKIPQLYLWPIYSTQHLAIRYFSCTSTVKTRNPNFADTAAHVRRLHEVCVGMGVDDAAPRVITDAHQLEGFNTDWLRQAVGKSPVVVLPQTTEEVSRVLQYCNANNIAVVPQGGNTGLVYGGVPVCDEVILSLKKFVTKTVAGAESIYPGIKIHKQNLSAQVDAGVILADLQRAANLEGLLVPLDLGARGSCTIGGNIATNAGGIHFARYGSVRSNVLGLEVVLADGRVVRSGMQYLNQGGTGGAVYKDNAGFDLKQMFIGSEGLLGVITRAEIKLAPLPKHSDVAIIVIKPTTEDPYNGGFLRVLKVIDAARDILGKDSISALEVMDGQGCVAVRKRGATCPVPSVEPNEFLLLIETHSTRCMQSSFSALTEHISDTVPGVDMNRSILATSESQRKELWGVREMMPVHLAQLGRIYKFDLCFALNKCFSIVVPVRRRIEEAFGADCARDIVVTGFGHLGDGNLHLNIVDMSEGQKHHNMISQLLYPFVADFTQSVGGSISAEHGIGRLKRTEFQRIHHLKKQSPQSDSESDTHEPSIELKLMRALKQTLDPRGILNPYKIL